MNNYEYIIAGLPVLQRDSHTADGFSAEAMEEEIRSQLDERDCRIFDFLLDGFRSECLSEEFYRKSSKSSSRFIRQYFSFDLSVRNARVEWLNSELGRPAGSDIMETETEENPELKSKVLDILSGNDILERERALDNLMWEKIEDITVMEIFSLDLILAFTAKMKIVDRWLKLDPVAGRELFRKLVEEIRNNR